MRRRGSARLRSHGFKDRHRQFAVNACRLCARAPAHRTLRAPLDSIRTARHLTAPGLPPRPASSMARIPRTLQTRPAPHKCDRSPVRRRTCVNFCGRPAGRATHRAEPFRQVQVQANCPRGTHPRHRIAVQAGCWTWRQFRLGPSLTSPSKRAGPRGHDDRALVQRCGCSMVLGSSSLRLPKLVGLRRSITSAGLQGGDRPEGCLDGSEVYPTTR